MAATDLVSASRVASILGADITDWRVSHAVAAASAAIVAETGRKGFHWSPVTVVRAPGYGSSRVVLNYMPVIAVIGVQFRQTLLDLSGVEIEDPDAGVIYNANGWPDTRQYRAAPDGALEATAESAFAGLVFTLEAGWVTPGQAVDGWTGPPRSLPDDLELAALSTAVSIYRSLPADRRLASERVLSASVSFFGRNTAIGRSGSVIPDDALTLLNPYRVLV